MARQLLRRCQASTHKKNNDMNAINSTKTIPRGKWTVDSVQVSGETACGDGEFQSLESDGLELQVLPAGIALSVEQVESNRAVMRSGAELYFGEFIRQGERLFVKLSRPAMSENVTIAASMVSG